jgi:oxazoline/thiazoline dehydrogenase
LRDGVSVRPTGKDQILMQSGPSVVTFRSLSEGTRTALQQLGSGGDYEDRLTKIVLRCNGTEELAKFYFYLRHLSCLGLLRKSVHLSGIRLATLAPISTYFKYDFRGIVAECKYLVSRFAYTRVEGGETLLESPLAHARIILHDSRAATVVHALARPLLVQHLSEHVSSLPPETISLLMALFLNAQMLTELNEAGKSLEDENSSLRSWEFHDLLFHSRSRIGRHDLPVGGTYRFAGQIDPPPALKQPKSNKMIDLYRPDLEQRKREDPSFTFVQEKRCSVREYDTHPITVRQLGEFLYRVGRVKHSFEAQTPTASGSGMMEIARRPYPGGGALYELELYLAVRACENLGRGLYHYEPQNHQLEPISASTAHIDGLLSSATTACLIPTENLQVLIVMATRFQRLSWKYASMAYALTLKNVGVLYQTMYLVATAMGLAPCALGCGDSDLFALAAGTNYYDETSVGEFLLGSKRDSTKPWPGNDSQRSELTP